MQQDEENQQIETEPHKISMWLIGMLGGTAILCFLLVIVLVVLPFLVPGPPTGEEEETSAASELIPEEVMLAINAIIEGDIDKAIKITDIKDDGKVYRIDIELVSEPESYSTVEKWTKIVCQRCSGILKEHKIERDIGVWAKYGENSYGRTYYTQDTGEFDSKKAEELK